MHSQTMSVNAEAREELKQKSKNTLSWTYKIGLPVLAVSLVAFGYQAFKSYYIPAYGNKPEEMAFMSGVDPLTMLGGDLTHYKFGNGSFSEPAANLPWQLESKFDAGDGNFERPVKAASLQSQGSNADGLGPIFNNTSCESCHQADGRTEPVIGGSLLLRLSVPGTDEHGGPLPHPVYGGQLGDVAIEGVAPEAQVWIEYEEIQGYFGDGEAYSLQKPIIKLEEPGYGPFGEDTMISARGAPAIFGIGLLDAISDETLISWEDPQDSDGDGISGEVNWVYDPEAKRLAPGRFGWKSEVSTARVQTAAAAVNDMGMTNPIFPEQECSPAQHECAEAIHGGSPDAPEFTEAQLDELAVYIQLLAVPARGHMDNPDVLRGEEIFSQVGCVACHKSTVVTGDFHTLRRLRGQEIHPYTDLLVHDMGPGLADNRPVHNANGQEWRTSPLWGIGLTETVNGHTKFLHDGRARNLQEAILWHGGEAEYAKEAFRFLPKSDREALIKFLKSL
ncbi:MAG: di-heme oxidoredictase family protein [Pseudomonadota bacterium]